MSAELAGQTSSSRASILKISVESNQDLAKLREQVVRSEIALAKRSGLPPDLSWMSTPYLTQAAKLAAGRYADRQAFSAVLADVVKTIQAAPPQLIGMGVEKKKTPEDDWTRLAAEVEELAEEADANDEEVDTFLQSNPELQNVVDELIQVVDFTDPIQRTRIVHAMKASDLPHVLCGHHRKLAPRRLIRSHHQFDGHECAERC